MMARNTVEIKPIRGKRLKKLCDENGITQMELANKVFISQQTISKIIKGKANLTETTARKISEVYPGYSFEWLMGYDMEPASYDSPLEFEKEWIRKGGGNHPLNNIHVVEARIAVALEKMNEKGWQLAVSLVETLCEMPDLKTKETEGK